MTPYYVDDLVTLYHGDCREILPSLAFDAVVSDPPYGLAFEAPTRGTGTFGRARDTIQGDDTLAAADWVEAYVRALHIPAVLFGMWQRVPTDPRRQLIWDKGQIGLSGTDLPWISSHEVAWVFGRGWEGTKRGTVYRTARARDTEHPTQKPVDLMQWIVATAPPQWVIADPFMGSGTTILAARNLARHAIGIELDERHCETAARRLSQNVLDLGGAA